MNYRAKRNKAGLSAYTMSKELGIAYDKYLKVEKKLIPLEGEYVDKFMKILDRAKEILFNRKQKIHEIEESIKDGSLKKLSQKRGYSGKQLAETMGISPSEVSRTFTGKQTNQDTIERIYDFLQDPINVNVESSGKKAPTLEETAEILRVKPIVEEEAVTEEIGEDNTNTLDTIETDENEAENNELDELKKVNHDLAGEFCRLIKENRKLHEDLVNAKHQIQMYEKLIERL